MVNIIYAALLMRAQTKKTLYVCVCGYVCVWVCLCVFVCVFVFDCLICFV